MVYHARMAREASILGAARAGALSRSEETVGEEPSLANSKQGFRCGHIWVLHIYTDGRLCQLRHTQSGSEKRHGVYLHLMARIM